MPILSHIFKKGQKSPDKKRTKYTKQKKEDTKFANQPQKMDDKTKSDRALNLRDKSVAGDGVSVGKKDKKSRKTGTSQIKSDQAYGSYNIIVRPHISEKSVSQNSNGKYVFEVYSRANKISIASAIETTYGVKVEKVNKITVPAKKRRYRRIEGKKSSYNKAVVTLKQGQEIEVLPQ